MAESFAYPHLFSPFRVGNLDLPNRVVMAPMSTELGGLDGSVTPLMQAFYRERALGGVGLIIVEYTCVSPETGRANPYQLTLSDERNLDGHKRLVQSLHAAGARVFMQIQHSGRFANAALLPDRLTVAPSDITSRKDPSRRLARALTADEVERMVEAFGRTAELAVEAGYDGVELHGAHGYLLSQFMSPLNNRRDDEWGGDFERRLRFPMAVTTRVKAAIGARPLSYRVSADEFTEGGLTIDDMERVTPRLVEAGADLIHASIGYGVGQAFETVVEPISTPEGWRLPYARRLRAVAGVPVIAVGQIRWPETAEKGLADGDADLIALGRTLLADPEWAAKARAGLRAQIRPCTSCNWCGGSAHQSRGRTRVGCAENPRTGSELDAPIPSDAGVGRKAVVVGAGPGGMAAALMLDQAGFETHLFESRPRLGGGLIVSATPPGKDKLFWYLDYLESRLKASGVRVHLNRHATPAELRALEPAVALMASGTENRLLPIDGADGPMVADAYEVLMGDVALPDLKDRSVVVYGGGETGCESAEYLAHHGAKVTLVSRSPKDKLARSAEPTYRSALVRRLLTTPNITVRDNCHIIRIADGRVTLEAEDGGFSEIEADRVLIAQGRQSLNAAPDGVLGADIAYAVIGDAGRVGRIGDAVHDAYEAVRTLTDRFTPMPRLAC